MHVSSRHHLRSDEVRDLDAALADAFGVDLDGDAYELVELGDSEFDLVLVDGAPLACYVAGAPCLTVRGANATSPTRGRVVVDAGAVSFVSDGADVMRPGIVEVDDGVAEGDLVLVVEETHGKALAVGRALVDGSAMVGDAGRVVESVHHVGDDLFDLDV